MTKKTGHASNDKVISQMKKGNERIVNSAIRSLFAEAHKIREAQKEMTKDMTDVFNRLMSEHNIPKVVARYEFRMQCLDPETRAQFELNHADLKEQTGYQMSLPLSANEVEKLDPIETANALTA